MQQNFITSRLALNKLQLSDTAFIRKLVNTDGWIKFIGRRDMDTEQAAAAYMHKLTASNDINYWVVTLIQINAPVGVITLIKRDYLPHHDIGFAFLPAYCKMGYAYEAAQTLLNDITASPLHQTLMATTLKENYPSISLLQKLGFSFDKEIERDNVQLQLYVLKQS
jgi:[ribosomal protein S5]-alanine N-acetyltransferase